ncbi:MAG: L-seryl-tRNA(Sec) selenium transferase, partial [Betaproteobacteria bacterium]|nr:L-seryl-tRNA(Sec) selenium transferase [Betaproteobacteria bacterium]
MVNPPDAARRALPSVDRLLQQPRVLELITQHGRPLVVETIRSVIDAQRAAMAQNAEPADEAT